MLFEQVSINNCFNNIKENNGCKSYAVLEGYKYPYVLIKVNLPNTAFFYIFINFVLVNIPYDVFTGYWQSKSSAGVAHLSSNHNLPRIIPSWPLIHGLKWDKVSNQQKMSVMITKNILGGDEPEC